MAAMNRLAQAAGVRRCGKGLHRDRDKHPRERQQEQKSGRQALHVMF